MILIQFSLIFYAISYTLVPTVSVGQVLPAEWANKFNLLSPLQVSAVVYIQCFNLSPLDEATFIAMGGSVIFMHSCAYF